MRKHLKNRASTALPCLAPQLGTCKRAPFGTPYIESVRANPIISETFTRQHEDADRYRFSHNASPRDCRESRLPKRLVGLYEYIWRLSILQPTKKCLLSPQWLLVSSPRLDHCSELGKASIQVYCGMPMDRSDVDFHLCRFEDWLDDVSGLCC